MKYFFASAMADDAADLIETYHYSGRVPANVQFVATLHCPGGLFGDLGAAVAACVFTIPPTRWSEDVWELARLVRRDDVDVSLSSLIAWACASIRRSQKQDLLISFADWTHKHHGGVYQAASWSYHGLRPATEDGLTINGNFYPGRSLNSRFGTRSKALLAARLPHADVAAHLDEGKHLYWRALSTNGRRKAERLGLKRSPYPKPGVSIKEPRDGA